MNDSEYEEIKNRIRCELLAYLDMHLELSDKEVMQLIEERIIGFEDKGIISLGEKRRLRKELYHGIRKLGILQELIDDSSITEIMVNGIIYTGEIGYVLCGNEKETRWLKSTG